MAEVGKAQDGTLRWRKSYVPGASGLDDAVQQRVEIYSLSGADVVSDTLYTLLRDEQNTVVALVEEKDGADPRSPPTPVRYHYTPYGEAHAETGAELLSARFDSSLKSVTKPDGTTVSQTTGPDGVDGGIRLALTLPPDPATLAGLLVERRNTDGTWGALTAAELALGQRPGAPEELEILPTSGFTKGATYRVRFQGLKDSLGRPATSQNFALDIPTDGTQVLLDRAFPLVYDSYLASGTTANGAFPGGQNLLFQGLWTDPVTGMGYARNRWYDARNAVFLTEDPLDDIDSPNVYGFVAGRPHEFTDPEGLLSAKNIAKAATKTVAKNALELGVAGGVIAACGPMAPACAAGFLLYGAIQIHKDIDRRIDSGQNGVQAFVGLVGDMTGLSGLRNTDLGTGADLGLTDEQREEQIGSGIGNLVSLVTGPMVFKGGYSLGAGASAKFRAWRATENTWPSIKPEEGWGFEGRQGARNPEPSITSFPEWRVGDPVTKIAPSGEYPTWYERSAAGKSESIQGRYWMNRASSAGPAEFSPRQLRNMRSGFSPDVKVLVEVDRTGAREVRRVSKELHHARRNRGVPGFDSPLDLREVWPWEHAKIDSQRRPGYTVIGFVE
jgi:RHS repeat-associated protein